MAIAGDVQQLQRDYPEAAVCNPQVGTQRIAQLAGWLDGRHIPACPVRSLEVWHPGLFLWQHVQCKHGTSTVLGIDFITSVDHTLTEARPLVSVQGFR